MVPHHVLDAVRVRIQEWVRRRVRLVELGRIPLLMHRLVIHVQQGRTPQLDHQVVSLASLERGPESRLVDAVHAQLGHIHHQVLHHVMDVLLVHGLV